MFAGAGIPKVLTAGLLGVALTGGLALAVPAAARGASAAQAAQSARAAEARPAVAPGTISTVAGGVGGPGPATSVSVAPCGVQNARTAVGMTFSAGQLHFPDLGENGENSPRAGDVIRAVSLATGTLTTPAGNGMANNGYPPGDGGPATAAQLFFPADVNTDAAGNLIVADSQDGLVRVVAATTGTFYGQAMTKGDIYAVAGNGHVGFPTSGAPALSTEIGPGAVATDRQGNLFIQTFGQIWMVPAVTGSYFGQAMTGGDIYQLKGLSGGGLRVDEHGDVVVAGGTTVQVDAAASGTFYGQKMTVGQVYVVAGGGSALGDGGPATKAQLVMAYSLAIDPAGDLILADMGSGRIRMVAEQTRTRYGQHMKAGDIYTVAGGGTSLANGAPALKSKLVNPCAVAVDSRGNIAFAVGAGRRVRAVAAATGRFYGQRMTAGHIYVIAGNGGTWLSGDGGPAARAQLYPSAEVTDSSGNVIFADAAQRVYRAEVRILVRRSGTYFGRKMTAGNVYALAGSGPEGFSGDRGPGTRARISLSSLTAAVSELALDRAGNLVFLDTGNYRVRVLAARNGTFYGQKMKTGDIYTVAGNGGGNDTGNGGPALQAQLEMHYGTGLAIDPNGNLAISEDGDEAVRLVATSAGTFYGRKMKAGYIYHIAGKFIGGTMGDGGPAIDASMSPDALACDARGNLLIADTLLWEVRVVAARTGTFYGHAMTAGHIYDIAGDGHAGDTGDGGPATSAELGPVSLHLDAHGNLLISAANLYSPSDSRVRVVAEQDGTFYGVPMTAGDIYTVAGDGISGYAGDGGPATSAEISPPQDAVASAAGLFIADSANLRFRLVTG
ncbi:MAG TPA: hypothetical protein VHU92_11710 [Streptosporangiaceae bacterium]|nr:hypothetical protein [Streptosporangiaceae bacterium]